VVEDSDEDYDTIVDALQWSRVTATLIRVKTGDQCLAALRADNPHLWPSFVLLDLNIPGLDGREVLSEIRRDVQLRKLPVIILSSSANPKDLAYCYHRGANAYHVKPVRYNDHLDLLAKIFTYWLSFALLPEDDRSVPA
jgi:CheY-like chemotaxis protein